MNNNLELSRLTVIIPSFGRQKYLDRQVDYWRQTEATILIIDGSPEAWKSNTKLPANTRYYHMPKSIEARFRFAAKLVETEYAILLSDDEFFLYSGLASCIAYLDSNVDVVACKGAAIAFQNYIAGVTVGLPVYPELRNTYAVDQSTEQGRMLQHMRPYAMATLWAVMRRKVFIATLHAMGADGPFKSAAAGELQTSLVAAYYGKCHVLNELVWLRSYENENIWWNDGRLSILEWYLDPVYSDEVERFYKSIESQIDVNDPILLRTWLISAMDAYVEGCRTDPRKPSFKSYLFSILRRNISKQIKLRVKNILRIARKYPRTLSLEAKILLDSGVKVNLEEIKKIEYLVTKFHINNINK